MTKKATPNKNDTAKLAAILAIGIIILIILSVLLINSLKTPTGSPEPTHIEIENLNKMTLSEAKAILESADVQYEVIPTDSRIPNQIERVDFSGDVSESGKLLVTIGTTVKLYANEVEQSKIIYLTFDDGPTRDNTLDILDTLDAYGILATFFVQGKNVNTYSGRIVETVNRGHLVGCHSYSHEIASIYSSIESFMSEIEEYEGAMKSAIGEEQFNNMNKVIRFPGGTTTNSMLSKTEAVEYISAVREKNYSVYDWTSLTGDAEGYSTAKDFIKYMSNTLESSKNANKPLIVLLHDKWSTNEALADILDYLVLEGYYFDTIDNCPEYTFAEN